MQRALSVPGKARYQRQPGVGGECADGPQELRTGVASAGQGTGLGLTITAFGE